MDSVYQCSGQRHDQSLEKLQHGKWRFWVGLGGGFSRLDFGPKLSFSLDKIFDCTHTFVVITSIVDLESDPE